MTERPSLFRVPAVLRALRIHQWVKNILVFIPLVTAHRVLEIESLGAALLAFAAFSLTASGVYLINDILDAEADRHHPVKRKRPIASGEMSRSYAALLSCLLIAAGFCFSTYLANSFSLILFSYFVLTCLYSLHFKKVAVADVVLLASMYALRVLAGGAATMVAVSQWLVGFSMFFFFSLACVKRYSELLSIKSEGKEELKRRGYQASDLAQVAMFGTISGYLSVLVLALYVSSREVSSLYARPELIWLACPLVLYWVSRVWLLAQRGLVHEDPIVFALSDRVSYGVGLMALGIMVAAL